MIRLASAANERGSAPVSRNLALDGPDASPQMVPISQSTLQADMEHLLVHLAGDVRGAGVAESSAPGRLPLGRAERIQRLGEEAPRLTAYNLNYDARGRLQVAATPVRQMAAESSPIRAEVSVAHSHSERSKKGQAMGRGFAVHTAFLNVCFLAVWNPYIGAGSVMFAVAQIYSCAKNAPLDLEVRLQSELLAGWWTRAQNEDATYGRYLFEYAAASCIATSYGSLVEWRNWADAYVVTPGLSGGGAVLTNDRYLQCV